MPVGALASYLLAERTCSRPRRRRISVRQVWQPIFRLTNVLYYWCLIGQVGSNIVPDSQQASVLFFINNIVLCILRSLYGRNIVSQQTRMEIADGIEPKAEWNRPHRISLLQNLFSERELPAAKVYVGGERLTFPYAEKFVNLLISQERAGCKVHAGIHENEDSIRKGTVLRWIDKHLGRGYTEEDIAAKVGEILAELAQA